MKLLKNAIKASISIQKTKFGCILDGTDDPYLDCVLDADWPGNGIYDCDYVLSNKHTHRNQCKYWVSIS